METNDKTKINKKRLIIVISIILAFIGLIAGLYFGLGFHKEFTDQELLREKIESYGSSAKIVYVLINFIQTTIVPITNIPTIIVGTYLFGPLESAIYAIVGVLVGSVVSFFFGRILGRPTLNWIVGEETFEKYSNMAKGRETFVIFLILLLPGFPDDIICMIAGATKMSWKAFLISILITRTIPIFMTAYLPELIDLSSWGGIAIIFVIYLIVFLIGNYILKNWDKVYKFFLKFRKKEA